MKYFFIAFIYLILLGCSSTARVPQKSWKFLKIGNSNYLDLRPGDIIIKEKELSLLGVFGHVGIMKSEREVVNYPKIGENIEVLDIGNWLEDGRKFIILRYVNMDSIFEEKLIKNLDLLISLNYPYKIFIFKDSDRGFYCSQFIWYLYFKTAKDIGYYLDIDFDGGLFVFPYDFIYSKEFYIVF